MITKAHLERSSHLPKIPTASKVVKFNDLQFVYLHPVFIFLQTDSLLSSNLSDSSTPTHSNILELEDNKEDCFARKRICIKTKLEDNILENFKIIVRGKNFVIRAKELFVWSPTLNDNKEVDDYSEDDSVNGAEEINGDISKQMNLDEETDIEGVSDIVFDDKADSLG
ncbi:hypothetical protein Tco_1474272, partial [Tanacetum coccineum]